MKTPHKHAELIKAWADGAEIQCWHHTFRKWYDDDAPNWDLNFNYRIKPEPKPDVIKYVRTCVIDNDICRWDSCNASYANLRLVFDGETGNLKEAQVLK